MREEKWLLLGATVCLLSLQAWGCAGDEHCDVGNSVFQQKYNYPSPWWVVYPADVPSVANTALTLRSALTTSYEDFAQQIILAIARNQTQAIAKSIGASLCPHALSLWPTLTFLPAAWTLNLRQCVRRKHPEHPCLTFYHPPPLQSTSLDGPYIIFGTLD